MGQPIHPLTRRLPEHHELNGDGRRRGAVAGSSEPHVVHVHRLEDRQARPAQKVRVQLLRGALVLGHLLDHKPYSL